MFGMRFCNRLIVIKSSYTSKFATRASVNFWLCFCFVNVSVMLIGSVVMLIVVLIVWFLKYFFINVVCVMFVVYDVVVSDVCVWVLILVFVFVKVLGVVFVFVFVVLLLFGVFCLIVVVCLVWCCGNDWFGIVVEWS